MTLSQRVARVPPERRRRFRDLRDLVDMGGRDLIAGELAALRVPELQLTAEPSAVTLRAAAECWQASRVDVAENTRTRHGLELARILPRLGNRDVEGLAPGDAAEFVATLTGEGTPAARSERSCRRWR